MQRQNMRIKRIICSIICILVCLSGMTVSAFASDSIKTDAKTKVTIKYSEEGTEFFLYRVAGVSADVVFTPTDEFKDYPLKWNGLDTGGWRALAETLDTYVLKDDIPETARAVVNDEGLAVAKNLDTGLYLVVGKAPKNSTAGYTPVPSLICLPSKTEEDEWDYNPTIVIKRKVDDSNLPYVIERRVIKNWEGDAEENRPEKIVVDLLKDGRVEDTVVLNKKNNWSYIWEELDSEYDWRVAERDIPEGYTVTTVLENKTFIITNTAYNNRKPLPEDEHLLPYTGQLWWPVPLLALAGMACLLIGLVRRRTLGDDDA